jgi:hemerythrin-like metal-binding protein
MEAFAWDQNFETGLETVDEQHHHLVEIVNQLSEQLVKAEPETEGKLQYLFKQLADYANYHFAEEERLMRQVGLDHRHVDAHVKHHHQFVEQVASMWRSRGAMASPAEVVHGFLTAWLTFHILGEDQVMARQIARVRAGESAAAAYEAEPLSPDSRSAALLKALHSLFHVMAIQGRDIDRANKLLGTSSGS